LVIASRALAARSPPGARDGSRPRRGSQPAYRPWPTGPACRPEGSRSAASPGHARRWRAWRLPSRPRSRTDDRARCPPWFSAVPAVSDRTGCSAASNWGKDPRRTVRPAQRSVTPRSARSCRRACTVTADSMAFPREQCVGADGEAPGRSPAESYFEPHRIGGQPSPRWGQAAGTTATRDRLGSVARLLRIRSCLTLTARPGGSSTGRRHLCQHCGEARIAYCVQTWLPIHLINRFYLSPAASSLLSAAGHGRGPPLTEERSSVQNSRTWPRGLDMGLAADLRWFLSLEGAVLLTPPGRGIKGPRLKALCHGGVSRYPGACFGARRGHPDQMQP
jgi:hypothetical protein